MVNEGDFICLCIMKREEADKISLVFCGLGNANKHINIKNKILNSAAFMSDLTYLQQRLEVRLSYY